MLFDALWRELYEYARNFRCTNLFHVSILCMSINCTVIEHASEMRFNLWHQKDDGVIKKITNQQIHYSAKTQLFPVDRKNAAELQ